MGNSYKKGRPSGNSNPSYALSTSQIHSLMNSCCGKHGLRNRAIVALGLHSGARIGTIINLTWSHIADNLRRCKTSYVIQAKNEKSGKTNRYYITKQGQNLIQDYLNSLNYTDDMPLFPSNRGNFMSPSSGSRLVANLLKKANILDNSSHSLRKTFISTLYVKHGLGLAELASLCNHSSIETTRIYVQGLEPNIQAAMLNLNY